MGALLAIGKWLIDSRLGQTLLLAVAIMVACYTTYKVIDHRAYARGKADCQADIIAKTSKANVEQAKRNEQRNADASDIAKKADSAGATAVAVVDTKNNETKEVIRNVYHTRVVTKPVAAGSCVHPVDERVQERFTEGVRAANG